MQKNAKQKILDLSDDLDIIFDILDRLDDNFNECFEDMSSDKFEKALFALNGVIYNDHYDTKEEKKQTRLEELQSGIQYLTDARQVASNILHDIVGISDEHECCFEKDLTKKINELNGILNEIKEGDKNET